MLPLTHADLVAIVAVTIAITVTVAGFSFMSFLVLRSGRESERHFAEMQRRFEEMQRLTRAVAGLVYQEEEKTRALLREHGWP